MNDRDPRRRWTGPMAAIVDGAELPFDGEQPFAPASIEDSETLQALDHPRGTMALPAVGVPDMTPTWARSPSSTPPSRPESMTSSVPASSPPPPSAGRVTGPPPPTEIPLDADAITLSMWAGLSASLHYRPDEEPAILEEATITPEAWRQASTRHEADVAAAMRRGRDDILAQHDEAYLAQLATEREAEIDQDTYVAVELATERGELDRTMARLRLPEPSLLPLKRHWLRKLLRTTGARQAVREALLAARG